MDALRTAVVLVLLLALGYGVWVVLNHDGGVEEPPSFDDWDAEVADGGVSGYGDGPFMPPSDDSAAHGDSAMAFGAPAAPAGADAGEAPAYGGLAAPTYDGATTDAAPVASRFAGGPSGLAGSADDPGMPPPPPGFDSGAVGNDETPVGADDAGSGDEALANAEPPAPPTDTGASRYGAEGGDLDGPATPLTTDSAGNRYGGATVPEPSNPSTQDTAAIPSKSSPITPEPAAGTSSASLAPPATIQEVIADAKKLLEDGEAYEALYTLSQRYGDPAISAADQRELNGLLDPLAGKVIYSTEHLLEEPYVARRGDSLKTIAEDLNVPYQLLQNINAVENPDVLTPGSQLKVVRGPFRAEINLAGNELTLFLGPLYAGRFPVSVGAEPSPSPGEYTVRGKEQGKAYFGANGASFPADHPSNPYGRYWIDLGNQMCIHGTPKAGDNAGMGCVSLSPVDAADVFGILSAGSKVVIRR